MAKYNRYLCPLCKGERFMCLKRRDMMIIDGEHFRKWIMECKRAPQHYLTLPLFNQWQNGEISRARIKSIMKEQARAEQNGRLKKIKWPW